jgi:hypothetical protein
MIRRGRAATRLFWRCRSSRIATPERRNAGKMFMKGLGGSQYNGGNREPLFVPGGSGMYILVPWKPVVLVWGLLSAMIFFGFVASSVLQGKDPFAPSATITQPAARKAIPAQAGQQPKHSHKAAQTPSQ